MGKTLIIPFLLWLTIGVTPSYGQKVERLNFVGGPPSGVFGIFATGIGTYLSKNVPNLDVSVTATGGSVENLRRVNGAEAEMGLSFASDVHEAFFGQEQFKGKPLNNFRAVGVVFVGVAHAITYADSGIRTAADLAGGDPAGVAAAACWAFANLDAAKRESILRNFCRARFEAERGQSMLDRHWLGRILRWFLSKFRTAHAKR